ncbi:unnamed protein product [Adineta ricciae]|uniref:Hexosyltransferase n=1 Tax=Adineta ricciae TaxID=249248 RepID=A0A814R0S7_ADIRI|nr:unnamed protein product [Adineta ricciae]
MWSYYQSYRYYYSRPIYRLVPLIVLFICVGILWLIVIIILFIRIQDANDVQRQGPPVIFCFVLSSNARHLTSSIAIVYSWGKRCDRFYFVTRLQNTSIDLMMLEYFENITDITPLTINQQTLNALIYLQRHSPYSSYHWFLRASDDSFVVMPNLRRLVNQLHKQAKKKKDAIVHVGDVDELYRSHQIKTTGSVMLFNHYALDQLALYEETEIEKDKCLSDMMYDHEFVSCMKKFDIKINPVDSNLIRSQNLSFYKMDKQLKDTCCSPETVAFRASNETDMYKFDFFYHRLDAFSEINV